LELRLIGKGSGRDAFGARAVVEAGGRRLYRELRSGGSYLSQSEALLHFGLGGAARIERLEVRWPSGLRQALRDVPPARRLVWPEVRRGPALAGSR
ncbi:MAG: ASPIC/UnbV domain-containing protein, partial [Thermoanaerobaculia bacterium]